MIAVVVVVLTLVGSLALACGVGFLLAEPPEPARIAGGAWTARVAAARPPAPELIQAG